MKCVHKQFTIKSVGSEWPPGVKESIRNPVIRLTLAWYAVLASKIISKQNVIHVEKKWEKDPT